MNSIIVVNAYTNGHHPFYLSLIIKSLIRHHCVIVLGESTKNIKAYLSKYGIDSLSIKWVKPNGKDIADFYTQSLSVAKAENASTVFYTYFDSFLEHVLSEERTIDHEVTGIWFHPHALGRQYQWIPGFDRRAKHRKLIHTGLKTKTATKNFQKIFFLDPNASGRLAKLNQNIECITIPDPGESNPTMDKSTARRHFKLPGKEKTIFLHIGTSEKRKGLSDTIKAFHLGLSDTLFRERAFLLRVGTNDRLSLRDRTKLLELVESGHASFTEGFVTESDFIEYLSAADVILLPYRKFRFSSGILVNAMNAGRPVLTSNYGMIGKITMSTASGKCFKDSSVSSLAKALVEQCRITPTNLSGIDASIDQKNFMDLISNSLNQSCV